MSLIIHAWKLKDDLSSPCNRAIRFFAPCLHCKEVLSIILGNTHTQKDAPSYPWGFSEQKSRWGRFGKNEGTNLLVRVR